MKKIKLSIATLVLLGFANAQNTPKKDSVYENRPLKIEEINFVSGYVDQKGNHSAITGGKGTENLTDINNNLDVKLVKKSGKYEHALDFNMGVDHHTSASTAYIETPPTGATTTIYAAKIASNPKTLGSTTSRASGGSTSTTSYTESSASKLYGWRFYPSLNYSLKNLENNTTFGIGAYYSYEFDYNSLGAEVSFVKASMDNNREFSAKAQAFFDKRDNIIPYELRTTTYKSGDWKSKNSYSLNLAYSQVINDRLQMSLLGDLAVQNGLLSTPYNRVYMNNNTVTNEKLPDNRLKIPVGIRANYFAGNNLIVRAYYRYYWDDWGVTAHSFNLELPVKLSPNVSLSPFYRFHHQNGAKYFNDYATTAVGSSFYTSDYDLSTFNSNSLGLNFHCVPANAGVFNAIDLRYSYYKRSDGLSGSMITLALKFK